PDRHARSAARRVERGAREARASGGSAERGAARAARRDRTHPARAAHDGAGGRGQGARAGAARRRHAGEDARHALTPLREREGSEGAHVLTVGEEVRLASDTGATDRGTPREEG